MSNPRERTFAETLNTWVQIIAIIFAAVWGCYIFIFKEIYVPNAAPINISISLQLKKVGTRNVKSSLVAIEFHVSATNPSSRVVYLLPSAWVVRGFKVAPSDETPDSFNKRLIDVINGQPGQYAARYADFHSSMIVAAGSLFSDQRLNPNETLAATVIFYVPRKMYDMLEVQTLMPSLQVKSGVGLEWGLNEENHLVSTWYLIGPGGEHKRIEKNAVERLGLQASISSSALSLSE